MAFAPLYLLNRFVFRLSDFFHHWYAGGSRFFSNVFNALTRRIDHVSSLIFFSPVRVLVRALLYILSSIVFAGLYLVWLSLPFLFLALCYRDLNR